MTPRARGSTLLELLVALPLMALLTASAVLLLLGTHRMVRSADSMVTAHRELRHAVAAIAADIRPLSGVDLIAWSDTSLEFNATVGTGIVCDGRGTLSSVDVLPITQTDAARTSWNTAPQAGDSLRLWYTDARSIPRLTPQSARLASAAVARGCIAAPLLQRASSPAAHVQHLVLTDPLVHAPTLGSPVRVTRRVRLALYRSSDGDWYIGRTAWNGTAWDVIQPVVGPLLAPARRGLRIDVRDSTGTSLYRNGALAAQLHVELRVPRRSPTTTRGGAPTLTDSAIVDMTLRGNRGGENSAAA